MALLSASKFIPSLRTNMSMQMEANQMLHNERVQWRDKQEIMLQHMCDALHWQQNAEAYDDSLQKYYQARFSHQMHTYRLNQVLYGDNIAMAMRTQNSQPEAELPPHQPIDSEDMCCSPTPPRQPLQAHEHNSMMASPQAVPHSDRKRKTDDCSFVWSAQCSKRQHQ